VSEKSIKPLSGSVLYFALNSEMPQDEKIRVFFSKLFAELIFVNDIAALLESVQKESDRTNPGVILDLRGDDAEAFDAWIAEYEMLHRALVSCTVLVIYEQDRSDKIAALAAEGLLACCALPIPWKQGTIQRVVDAMRNDLEKSAGWPGAPLTIGGSKEYIRKLNAANSFYANHARSMLVEAQQVARLAKIMSQDEEAKSIPFLGGLVQHAEVLEESINELQQFATQDWHTYQHRTIFDINTVLDTVSSTSIPILRQHGIDLIFEVNNNVPSRLKGYPLGITSALITLLELMTQAKIQDELILRISLEHHRQDESAVLHIQFMQSHYRGSVTEVVVSAIQDDESFVQLLEKMDEIEGVLLHDDHSWRGDILQLSFRVQTVERRSYRLPSRDIMEKTILIIDDRKKNAAILQGMLRYFHLFSTVSTQVDEAIEHVRDHEYDVVIVAEKLARQCAKACKQAQKNEKFIVINSKKGLNSSFLGLDLADSFLNEPFTHKGIFNAIVDVFSDESLEGRMEDLQTLKTYLDLLLKHKRMLLVHDNAVVVRSVDVLLEEMDIDIDHASGIGELSSKKEQYDYLMLALDSATIQNQTLFKPLLDQTVSLSRDGKIVCMLKEPIRETDLEIIAAYPTVMTYIEEPIDPEAFYKILLDWAMSKKK
jgi:CheY-like chemotaxis protein